MNVTLRMEYLIPTVKYGAITMEAAVQLSEDDLEVDPDDRRDLLDIALERAIDAVDQVFAPRLQSLIEQNVADDKTYIIKIAKTLNALQEFSQ